MKHYPKVLFKASRVGLGAVGIAVLLAAWHPSFIWPEGGDSWTTGRTIQVFVGINMLITAVLLLSRRFQRWVIQTSAWKMLSPLQVVLLLLLRTSVMVAGFSITAVVLAADWLGLDPTPGYGRVRVMQLAAGIGLLVASYLLYSKPLQRMLAEIFGLNTLAPLQIIILQLTRIAAIVAGLITMFFATAADWLGMDSSPGWGHMRTLQLLIGASLFVSGLVLHNKGLHLWFMREVGFRMVSPAQVALLLLLQAGMALAGIAVTFLVIFADALGIDPTPGWGMTRTLQLIAGLALLTGGFVLHNRSLWKWLQRSLGGDKA